MAHWQKYTCIRFETYDPVRHGAYRCKVLIQYGDLCGGFIGYITTNYERVHVNNLYLGKNCPVRHLLFSLQLYDYVYKKKWTQTRSIIKYGTVIHELGHIIGFGHEQARQDRDQHIRVDFSKIPRSPQDLTGQYQIMENTQPDQYNVQYDLSSIMHYGSGNGILTALDSRRSFLMGQRIGLSYIDIQTANAAYKCAGMTYISIIF